MNALQALIAEINGAPVRKARTACPQGQAPQARPRKPVAQVKPVKLAPAAVPPAPTLDQTPALARALALLRAELGKAAP